MITLYEHKIMHHPMTGRDDPIEIYLTNSMLSPLSEDAKILLLMTQNLGHSTTEYKYKRNEIINHLNVLGIEVEVVERVYHVDRDGFFSNLRLADYSYISIRKTVDEGKRLSSLEFVEPDNYYYVGARHVPEVPEGVDTHSYLSGYFDAAKRYLEEYSHYYVKESVDDF